MQAVVIVTACSIVAFLFVALVHQLHNKDEESHEMLADSKRTDELINEAMQRYPAEGQLVALTRYQCDNLRLIQTLKANAEKADVIEALKFSLRDQRLMSQEVARLFRIEINNESSFNVLTAAQV